jgi:hypothetical protein
MAEIDDIRKSAARYDSQNAVVTALGMLPAICDQLAIIQHVIERQNGKPNKRLNGCWLMQGRATTMIVRADG